jgi:2-polyprenyl-3-methyl-5-hydroxy-6-metoxy-1,4-benzoquinol methylase
VPVTIHQSRCPICGSADISLIRPMLARSRFNLAECRDCVTQFLDPEPSLEESHALYGPSYYKSWNMSNGENDAVRAIKHDTFDRCIRFLQTFVQHGTILDVGTATGFFMESATAAGFDAYGVERSEYAARIAAGKFGVDHIHIGTLESAPFKPSMFDAVVMTDLLEHVSDPLSTLRRAHALLKPRGAVLITTPNVHSLSRTVMGYRWTHYKAEHLFYFCPKSMAVLAARAGFRIGLLKPLTKTVSIEYLRSQLSVYRNFLLTPAVHAFKFLPKFFSQQPMRLKMGEMLVILLK